MDETTSNYIVTTRLEFDQEDIANAIDWWLRQSPTNVEPTSEADLDAMLQDFVLAGASLLLAEQREIDMDESEDGDDILEDDDDDDPDPDYP